MSLIDAARNGDIQRVQELLENGADINSIGYDGDTALIRASDKGYVDIVKLLLDYGADPNIQSEEGGDTALILASTHPDTWHVYTDIVRLLLENGANPNIQTEWGQTALSGAKNWGHTDIVKLLENHDKEDDPPDEPDRDLQKYESARDIQRRFRGNRQRRQLTKKAPRYGKMYGPATRKETMRRWVDLSKQFDGDDVLGYLASTTYPFSKKGGKKKRRKTKKKKRKTKKKKK